MIYFTRADLLDAVQAQQKAHGQIIGDAEILAFDPALDEALTLRVWRDLDTTETITLSREQVAAAMIAKCQSHNIPLPKDSIKKLEKWRRGAALVVHSRELDIHVMVIDDQMSMREIVKRLLASVHITRVTEAGDGDDALELLRGRHDVDPDVIICDLYMKKMDGVPFLHALRQAHDGFFRDTPVLILTSETKDSVLDMVRRVGASRILRKPISAGALFEEIRQVLGFVDKVDLSAGKG
jgi:two-component system chemotaxis response regulator CheY